MKNNITLILTTIAAGALVLIATTKDFGSHLPAMAVGVSYVAVAILVALAAMDYRVGFKSHIAR